MSSKIGTNIQVEQDTQRPLVPYFSEENSPTSTTSYSVAKPVSSPSVNRSKAHRLLTPNQLLTKSPRMTDKISSRTDGLGMSSAHHSRDPIASLYEQLCSKAKSISGATPSMASSTATSPSSTGSDCLQIVEEQEDSELSSLIGDLIADVHENRDFLSELSRDSTNCTELDRSHQTMRRNRSAGDKGAARPTKTQRPRKSERKRRSKSGQDDELYASSAFEMSPPPCALPKPTFTGSRETAPAHTSERSKSKPRRQKQKKHEASTARDEPSLATEPSHATQHVKALLGIQ